MLVPLPTQAEMVLALEMAFEAIGVWPPRQTTPVEWTPELLEKLADELRRSLTPMTSEEIDEALR